MSASDLICPSCGKAVRLREGASRRAGKLVYACRGCERSFSFLGEDVDLVEEPGIEDSGMRTARMPRMALAAWEGSSESLREMAAPSESEELPPGVAVSLEITDGPGRGSTLSVSRSRSFLGRDPLEIQVADPLVSRRHAVLEIYDPETIILKDLSSTNGTYHNGRLIDHCKLSDGDELRMGSSVLSVLIDQIR